MQVQYRGKLVAAVWAAWAVCAACTGCHSQPPCCPADSQIPRELAKVSLPAYVIEPPDILLLDAVRVVPKPPYRIEPLDAIAVQLTGLGDQPLDGIIQVDSDGSINLGQYGSVRVIGQTLAETRDALERYLKAPPYNLKDPKAVVGLAQSRGLQQIRGEHLVRPDGTVTLGTYGSAYITGMTITEAKAAIEHQLSQFLVNPQVSLDVLAYNSKVYYVVTDGAGYGQQVVRLPITGNETVLDALGQIGGLPAQASQQHIWVARPAPVKPGCAKRDADQILPVDWNAIVMCGETATNYQLLPGDRVYVKAQALITLDNSISKIVAPLERLFGVTLLGNSTIRNFGRNNGNNNNTGNGGVGG